MKLTKTTDYSIRLLMYLAENKKSATMQYLSEELCIPYHNLTKIVQSLSKAKLILTQKGKSGGVQLLASSDDITIKTVVDLIDGPTQLSECQQNDILCGLSGSCRLKDAFADLQLKINHLLDSVSIKDLVTGN